jgi:radical SAM superfamily enzyme YgiQ (UPF0313 family)
MRVLLLNPPQENMITTNIPSIVEEERGINPPLGLLYVAAYALLNTAHTIEVLDMPEEGMGYDELEVELRKRKPDLVGITVTTFTLIDAVLSAKTAKKVDKNVLVVLGGPHVNLYPDETASIPEVDFIVLGEGEVTFAELIDGISNGRDPRGIPGIAFKDNGSIVNTGVRPLMEDLDALPFPARRLTPYTHYYSLLGKGTPSTTMMTSRGCPFHCLFCERPHLGRRFRARSAANVVDELQECVGMGIREFLMYDDTLTVNRQRVLDICDEILRRRLDVRWDIRATIDTVDGEMLKRLRKAGCDRIHFGVESASPEILKILRKRINPDQVREVFKKTKEAGISILAYFIIGSPTETREQILETIRFARELDPDFVHISVMTPFPGTDMYRLGFEKGIYNGDYWREFARNPTPDFVPKVIVSNDIYSFGVPRPGYRVYPSPWGRQG